MTISLKALTDQARELQQQRKFDAAIELFAQATAMYPYSAVAEHNLAGVLGDAGRASEAETHLRRAFAKGLNAPESWLVLARALLAQGKLEEAHEAFAKTIELANQRTAHFTAAAPTAVRIRPRRARMPAR